MSESPQVVYVSITGQTRCYVQKLPDHIPTWEIDAVNPFREMTAPFILVVPTYEREVVEVVDDFLQTHANAQWCQGVFGGGNRNFAELFCFTAKDIAREYQIPLLHLFEFQGSALDVNKLIQEVEHLHETTSHPKA